MSSKTTEPVQTDSLYVVETKYSIKEAATRIGISPSGVRRLLNTGKLGYYQSGRRRIIGEGHIQQYGALIARNSTVQTIH
jgi:excisionase family DNA binding protein